MSPGALRGLCPAHGHPQALLLSAHTGISFFNSKILLFFPGTVLQGGKRVHPLVPLPCAGSQGSTPLQRSHYFRWGLSSSFARRQNTPFQGSWQVSTRADDIAASGANLICCLIYKHLQQDSTEKQAVAGTTFSPEQGCSKHTLISRQKRKMKPEPGYPYLQK